MVIWEFACNKLLKASLLLQNPSSCFITIKYSTTRESNQFKKMKVETFKIAEWEEEETGLIIDENDIWILVKHIPVDFVIDGFKLYKKEFVVERIHGKNELLVEKVLGLKGVTREKPKGFEFTDTLVILKWSEMKYGIFEFQDCDQGELFYESTRIEKYKK